MRAAVDAVDFPPGGYRYLPGVFQYSAGVAAQPGYAIERVSFVAPKPLQEGFDAVEAFLRARERPMTAFCACELRSPAPFSEQGFTDFNRHYVRTLERWGLYRDGLNPVARTNVCPGFDPPDEPSLLAFSYTVPVAGSQSSQSGSGTNSSNWYLTPIEGVTPIDGMPGTFVIAGGGEARDGGASYRESIVRLGDVSTVGLRDKVRYVVGEMERRLAALGFTWRDAAVTRAYTVHDIGPLVRDELFARGAAPHGLTWDYARPPIVDIEFEMDVRRPLADRVMCV